MAKITVNGREIEAEAGAPLVEVLTNLGLAIPTSSQWVWSSQR